MGAKFNLQFFVECMIFEEDEGGIAPLEVKEDEELITPDMINECRAHRF